MLQRNNTTHKDFSTKDSMNSTDYSDTDEKTGTSSLRRKGLFAATVLFVLSSLLVFHHYSISIVSLAATIHNSLTITSFVALAYGRFHANSNHRSLFSSEQLCDANTVSMLIESKTNTHSNINKNDPYDESVKDVKRNNLRQSTNTATWLRNATFSIVKQASANSHKLSAIIPTTRRSKVQFCLHHNSEYILFPDENSEISVDMRMRICGEGFASTTRQIIIRTDSERCFAKEGVKSSISSDAKLAEKGKKPSLAAADCTEDPTSSPTSMPTKFVDPDVVVPVVNSTSSGSGEQIYESTTFISTVSAVGGTAVVATAGGVAYAAARSAKYFVQVPFAPDELAMQI